MSKASTRICPECQRPVPEEAASCPWSACHAYFDKSGLLWLRRDAIQERARKTAEAARKAAEEKERKKRERAEAKTKAEAEKATAES